MRENFKDRRRPYAPPLITVAIFISVILLDGISTAPTSNPNGGGCKAQCPSTNKGSKLKYLPNNVYTYNFESNAIIQLTGGQENKIEVKVNGLAQVYGLSNCQVALELQDVNVAGWDATKWKLNDHLPLSKIVRFTLSNDKLEPEICADPSDTEASLNIKRAIISLLQSDESNSHETDVFGTCPTSFSSQKAADGSHIITKTRKLNGCSHRESLGSGLVAGIFNEQSGIKSTPLLNADYNSEQRINKNGVIERAQVKEEYTLVPLTIGENGAKAHVLTKINLKGQKNGSPNGGSVSVSHSIHYQNPDKLNGKAYEAATDVWQKTVQSFQHQIGPKAASQFTELIRLLRHIKKDDLLVLFHKSNSLRDTKDLAKKVFLDALFRAGTADSVGAVIALLKGKELDDKHLAYLSLNLATSVNKDTLDDLQKLLETAKDVPKEAYLSIGSLIRKYCEKNSCAQDELKGLFDKLFQKLEKNKKRSDVVLAILKGFHNAKYVPDAGLDRLIQYSSASHSNRIRVAAIQAFASGACNANIQGAALKLLKDHNEDAEIRIESYLALVECPNAHVASQIKSVLDDEPVYQVGSFITSHLASLRASTSPHRENARSFLSNIYSSKKFPSDIRKYSFNHEWSYQLTSAGVGSSVDSSVIYSQKSFLPRSVSLNLTGEIFGTDFNILELNGRQENLDVLLERYLGPKGVLSNLNYQDVASAIHKTFHGASDKRSKRGISEDVNQFAKANAEKAEDHSLDLDLSIKMFGSDLYFLSLGNSLPQNLTRWSQGQFERFLKATSEGVKKNFEWHSLFLDADLVYPTSIGLPLKLQAQGASAARVHFELQADLKQIAKNPQNTKFHVKVVPSINVEITGTLGLDAYVVSNGLQVSSSAHSSTGSSLAFALSNDGKGVDVKVEFPLHKQEVFSFDHKVEFVIQELGKQSVSSSLKFPSQQKNVDTCFDQIQKYTGATLCFNYNPAIFNKDAKKPKALALPFRGPSHFSVSVELAPVYQFNANYDNKVDGRRALTLTFDTPNSKPDNRKISLQLEGEITPKIYAKVGLESAYKNAVAEVGVVNTDTEFALYAKGTDFPDRKLGFSKSGPADRTVYTPLVQLGEEAPYNVNGRIIVDTKSPPKVKYIFEKLQIVPKTNDAVIKSFSVDGSLEREKTEAFLANLNVGYNGKQGTVTADINLKEGKHSFDASILSNFAPWANGKAKLVHAKSATSYKKEFYVVYGTDFESKDKRIGWLIELQEEKDGNKLTGFTTKNKLHLGFLPLHFALSCSYKKDHIDWDASINTSEKLVSSKLTADANQKSKGDWKVDLDLGLKKHSVNLHSSRTIDDAAQKSSIKNLITSNSGTNIALDTNFKHTFNRNNADVTVDGSVQLLADQPTYKIHGKVALTPKKAEVQGDVSSGPSKLVKFSAVCNHNGPDYNGNVDLSVENLLTAKGQFKSEKGVGDSSLEISVPKIDRKLKVQTQYKSGANKIDVHTDFFYNYEKDNSQVIVVDTKNEYSKLSINSANKLTIDKSTYEFNVAGQKSAECCKYGTIKGNFLVKLPSLREIAGSIDRTLTLKGSESQGHGIITISDTIVAGGNKKRSIELEGNLQNANFQLHLFDISHKLTLKDFDNKDVVVQTNIKHLPKNQYKTASASLLIQGAHVPNAVDVSFNVEEYCPIHAVYKINLKHGNSANINLNGDYNIGEPGSKPSTYNLKVQASIPETKLKQLQIGSQGSFNLPASNDPNGQYKYSVGLTGSLNGKPFSLQTNGKADIKAGDAVVDLKLPDTDPFGLSLDYNHNEDGSGHHKGGGNVEVRYGNGQNIRFTCKSDIQAEKEIQFQAAISTPYEQIKKLEFFVKAEKKQENAYANEVKLTVDDKVYQLISALVVSNLNPSIDINVYYPQNKHSQLSASGSKLGDHKEKVSIHVVNVNGFSLSQDTEVNFESVENFGILIDVNSEALGAKDLHIDIHSKPNGGGKGIEFNASNDKKNILNGHAEYSVKDDNKGKTIIEGRGNVHLYDKANVVNFHFEKNDLNEKDESGKTLVFNGSLGKHTVVAELKVTNKVFHVKHTICQEKEPCIHLEAKSDGSYTAPSQFAHNLLIVVNLQKLGIPHELKLKSNTKRDGKALHHNLDIDLNSVDNIVYQYKAYLEPSKAGILLTIPTRIVAIEADYAYPKKTFGTYRAGINAYLDKKNHPDRSSSVNVVVGLTQQGKTASGSIIKAHTELTVSQPSVKELKVKGDAELNAERQFLKANLELDVFKTTKQAIKISTQYQNSDFSAKAFNITSSASLTSQDLNLNYKFHGNVGANVEQRQISFVSEVVAPSQKDRFGIYLQGNDKQIDLNLIAFNEKLLHSVAQLDTSNYVAAVESKVQLLGGEAIQSKCKISPKEAYASVQSGKFLNIEAKVQANKEITLEVLGNQKSLINGKIAIDKTNLLSTSYELNENEFKTFVKSARSKTSEDTKKAREELNKRYASIKSTLTTQVNAVKNNLPDFSNVNAEYKQEWEKFGQELLADKSIKRLVQFYQDTYNTLNKSIGEILRTLTEQFNKTTKIIDDFFKQLYEGFNERIFPSIKESLAKIEQAINNLFDEFIDVSLSLVEKLVKLLKKHEDDIKHVAKTVTDSLRKLAGIINEQIEAIVREGNDVWKVILDQINQLPGFDELKQRLQEILGGIVVPENIIGTLRELTSTLQDSLQIKELNDLIESILDYIEKKLKKVAVNDEEALKNILNKILAAFKAISKLVSNQLGAVTPNANSEQLLGLPVPDSIANTQLWPTLGSVKLSIWNYIRNEPLPSPQQLIYSYRPRGLNPLNSLPPLAKQGRIINGIYLFTFDGQQITVPGSCQYVLARDNVDGNFTVVGKVANNNLESIALVDKSGDSIEANKDGIFTVNGKTADLPVHQQNLHAWRSYYSLTLLSTYGVRVHCKLDLKICHVLVNGYYHSKLRGLLGNGDNEPYGDWQLPNGKPTKTLTSFVNAQKLQSNCPNVNVDEQHEHAKDDAASEECDKLFGASSTLRLCDFLIDAKPYIGACKHAVKGAANKQEAACDIALGYVSLCRTENIPVSIPSVCQKCQYTEDSNTKTFQIGEHYTVKSSQKKADIVLVIDLAIDGATLTELVNTLITDLKQQLKSKVPDVNIAVIGYKKGEKYLSHFTSNGKLDIQKLELKPESQVTEPKLAKVGCYVLDPLLEEAQKIKTQLLDDLSLASDGRAFREAMNYPFRSNANKIIIAVRSDSLTHSVNPLKYVGARLANAVASKLGLVLHLIAPIDELTLDNQKDAKGVVGFNSKGVVLLNQKNPQTQLRPHLSYGSDLGIDLVETANKGYIFSLNNYEQTKDKKKFVSVVSHVVADQIIKSENTNECVCTLYKGLFAREFCTESESKMLPAQTKAQNRG